MPIIRINQDDPIHDGRQSQTALMIQRGMTRHLEKSGHVVLSEFPLPNGRRADLLGLDRKGYFTIIEIKSSIEDFKVDQKWPEYIQYCDRFAFATCSDVPSDIFPDDEALFIADAYQAEMLRDWEEKPLHASTRKALTLRFARMAAKRNARLERFAEENGLMDANK